MIGNWVLVYLMYVDLYYFQFTLDVLNQSPVIVASFSAVQKHANKRNLKEKGFIWVTAQVYHDEKSGQLELEAADHILSAVRKQRCGAKTY